MTLPRLSRAPLSSALVAIAITAGCYDVGYENGRRHPDDLGGPDASRQPNGYWAMGDCLEGPVEPLDTGTQIQFVSRNSVDKTDVTIASGDTITWTNTDRPFHNAVAGDPGAEVGIADGGFNSGDLASGDRWAFRFCVPRSLRWFCSIHASMMNGYTILVTE